jgi:hypothetical protein
MKRILLTKNEVLSFNIWANYFHFLESVKNLFEKELAAKLSGEKISSFIDSGFYEKDGAIKEDRPRDYPDSEEIHLEVENRKHSVGFSFYDMNASKPCLDFYSIKEEDGKPFEDLVYYGSITTDLFSPEIIEASFCWIQTGTLNDFIKTFMEASNEA